MDSLQNSPPDSYEKLLESLASVRRLEHDITEEIRARGYTVALVPLCGHPNRPVAGIKVNGLPACNPCACADQGIPERDVHFALKDEPERDAWSDGVLPFVRKAMWPS